MIIIGEKINGSIPSVAAAIAERDAELIRQRAIAQAEAGAAFIDCCASVPEAQEPETLKWMIDCIQEVTDLPISLDSPSPRVLAQVIPYCRRPGLINSVSMEGDKCDVVFPIIADTQWQVIGLLCDDTGIPKCAADRLRVFDKLMAKAEEYGIAPERIHIDPLIEMLCTSEEGIAVNEEVISSVRRQYPEIHITAAVSNISFNLPVRKLINQGFTMMAMRCGLDSAILDPLNKDLMGLIRAAEALLSRGMDADTDLSEIESLVEEKDRKYVLPAYAVLALRNGVIELEPDEYDEYDLETVKEELMAKGSAGYSERDLLGLLYAAVALMGRDDYCMNYIGAYRDGTIGPVKA